MIEIHNETAVHIPLDIIEKITKELTDKKIELIITTQVNIQKLNKEFRQKDRPTDVLSFPYEPVPGAPLGSIVINIDALDEAAKKFGHTVEDELILLFIHGLLHLLGYDHEIDNGEMRQKEQELVTKFNLPKSLIVRNDG